MYYDDVTGDYGHLLVVMAASSFFVEVSGAKHR